MAFRRTDSKVQRKKKPTTAEIALRADKKANKALRAEEKKWQYYKANLISVVSNASIAGSTILFGQDVVQGPGYNQRSGVEIIGKSVKGSWVIKRTTSDCVYRMMVLWDKEMSINPSSTTFLTDVNTTEVVVGDFNPDNRGRFQVLYDSGPIALTSNNSLHTHSFSRKIEKKTQYQFNTTTMVKGGFRMLFYSDVPIGSIAQAPILNYVFKYKFTE